MIKHDGKILPLKYTKFYQEYNYRMEKSNNLVTIHCGKCKECLQAKMLELRQRILNELKINPKAYFITLTYDEEHKKNLNKRDMQLFIKRYRKTEKLRYFYRGELGKQTKRPHYHAIIWADMPSDIKEYGAETKSGYKQYTSTKITKLWGNGIATICKMTTKLVNYIVKYTLKNLKGEEIMDWSRRPPIGVNTEKIEQIILSPKRTKADKKYYKYRNGNVPELEIEKERQELRIAKIEQQKIKLFDYLKKKRRKYFFFF